MKNIFYLGVLFVGIGFQSCQNTTSEKRSIQKASNQEKPLSVACYVSVYEKDSIQLELNTFKDGKVNGDMVMKFYNTAVKKGKLSGVFSGDTLLVSYTFIEGTNEKITFKNPMAFLKRNDSLVLGNGKMQTTMGATYFVKGEPIDFDRVKFKFTSVDCE
ncbi:MULTISPECIES: hypothetical protein [unclassified Flavobacterium]|uniref:hypothetical protein n=1 Tax=unclassified Flavobacterium TaxID=196869 RepID=UPI00131AA7C1|nr:MULTISPECIES: hypothetical protein [unclassified Flavobacterium]